MLETAQHRGQTRGALAAIFGIGLLLFGASGVFAELQDALNTIWEVQPKKQGGILSVIKARFVSFTMVLGTAFTSGFTLIDRCCVRVWRDVQRLASFRRAVSENDGFSLFRLVW